jgi:hypothetical protein
LVVQKRAEVSLDADSVTSRCAVIFEHLVVLYLEALLIRISAILSGFAKADGQRSAAATPSSPLSAVWCR